MKATETRVEDFLSTTRTRFVIPVYQRNYDWTYEQCQQLFSDIVKVGQDRDIRAHFIGSIVHVHDDVYTTTGTKELVIIDGQQRLTTLTLIFLAIYKLAEQLGDQQLAEEIYETYLINKFSGDDEKLKLKPTENNDKAFQFLLSDHHGEEFPEFSRLVDNFEFFQKNINEENYKTVLQGLRKLIFVEIALDRANDNPQRIFESLNSTGLELSQADLIRNYILMGLSSKDQTRVYKDYWSVIERYAKEELKNQSRVSDFIRDYLTLKSKKIPNKKNVYIEFKNKNPEGDLENMEAVLKELKHLVIHYNKLLNPQQEKSEKIRQQLHYIDRLEINVAYPFLLQVYDDFSQQLISEEVFIAVLELVQSFNWRRFIMGLPTNALNKIFMNLYEKVEQQDYLASIQRALLQRAGNQRFPRDKEVIEALKTKDVYNAKSKSRMYLLERLEHFNNKERIQIYGNSDITIEHIFPQNPDGTWKERLTREDFTALKETYLHTISNLTLSGNNGKLGNKGFAEKRDLPDGGYKDSSFWLNKHLAALEDWNVATLEGRFQEISQRFLAIWPFPDVQYEDERDEYQELNIFEADDPKNKTLEYAIFMDEKIPVTNITQLYVQVMSLLFELQPEAFYSSDLFSRIGLVKGQEAASNLRQAASINDNYYIETNFDSNGKFDRIKHALTIFELEDELSIKYAS